jgi:para-aminobenzoate synthetase component 1
VKDNRAYFQVGGAIVYDSEPEDEYQETLHKGRALVDALNM